MKQAVLLISVEDDFEVGCCHNCEYKQYDNDDFGYCVFGKSFDECPVRIIDDKNELQ